MDSGCRAAANAYRQTIPCKSKLFMNIVESNLDESQGVHCWQPRWDSNLNLGINFGEPHLSNREPTESKSKNEGIRQIFKLRGVSLNGEWFFWVISGYWRLSVQDFGNVTKAGAYKRIKVALARLEGQKLIRAMVNSHTSATKLDFDLGARLTIRRTSILGNEAIWSLYKPNKYVISVKADGKYYDHPEDTYPDKIDWKLLGMKEHNQKQHALDTGCLLDASPSRILASEFFCSRTESELHQLQ